MYVLYFLAAHSPPFPQPYYQAYASGAPVELDYVSIAMIVVGYYIGTMAAKALGVDGTCKFVVVVVVVLIIV
jgi:hypothetical protein